MFKCVGNLQASYLEYLATLPYLKEGKVLEVGT